MRTVPNLDVVIVGPVPPPRAGVSSHVERLALLLEDEGFRVGILDHSNRARDPRILASLNRNPARYWLHIRRVQATVVHYHHSRLDTLLAAALARRNSASTWIVTFHGDAIGRSLTSKVPGVALACRRAIGRFDRIIAVSTALGDVVCAQAHRSVTVIPAYLPIPERDDTNPDVGPVTPTAIVSASRVATRASVDRYGLDIACAIFAAAQTEITDLRLEIFLTEAPRGKRARAYLERVLGPLRDAGLQERVRVHIGSELYPAFCRGAVYLRPTRTDGDAVSIREALDAGVPVLASDVVKRPAGASELPLDDVPAWVTALSHAIDQSRSSRLTSTRSREHAQAMVLLYREEVGGRPDADGTAHERTGAAHAH